MVMESYLDRQKWIEAKIETDYGEAYNENESDVIRFFAEDFSFTPNIEVVERNPHRLTLSPVKHGYGRYFGECTFNTEFTGPPNPTITNFFEGDHLDTLLRICSFSRGASYRGSYLSADKRFARYTPASLNFESGAIRWFSPNQYSALIGGRGNLSVAWEVGGRCLASWTMRGINLAEYSAQPPLANIAYSEAFPLIGAGLAIDFGIYSGVSSIANFTTESSGNIDGTYFHRYVYNDYSANLPLPILKSSLQLSISITSGAEEVVDLTVHDYPDTNSNTFKMGSLPTSGEGNYSGNTYYCWGSGDYTTGAMMLQIESSDAGITGYSTSVIIAMTGISWTATTPDHVWNTTTASASGYAPIVSTFGLELNNGLINRDSLEAETGVYEVKIGERAPQVTINPEVPPKEYAQWLYEIVEFVKGNDTSTYRYEDEFNFGMYIGGLFGTEDNHNGVGFFFPRLYPISVAPANKDGISTWELTLRPIFTTGDDELVILRG